MYTDEQIAQVVHAANRAVQYVQGDDFPSLPWYCEPRALRQTVLSGVKRVREGTTPQAHHHAWCIDKAAQGWTYGPEKDPERKTHPFLLPWEELPAEQRLKARLFQAIVLEMTREEEEEDGTRLPQAPARLRLHERLAARLRRRREGRAARGQLRHRR